MLGTTRRSMFATRVVGLSALVAASLAVAYIVVERISTNSQISAVLAGVLAALSASGFGCYAGITGRRRIRANDPTGRGPSSLLIGAGGAIGAATWAASGFVVRTYVLAILLGVMVAAVMLFAALCRAVSIDDAVRRMRRYESVQRSRNRDAR